MNTILIAGGTGFVGKYLVQYLLEKGFVVHVLTRTEKSSNTEKLHYFLWNIDKKYIDEKAFENVECIINLTGANIGEKRWTEARKKEILNSRVEPINLLYYYVKKLNITLKLFISSSAVGYYGAITTDTVFTEKMPNGKDFLASVCKQWEKSAFQFANIGIRTVVLRKGVVLGKEDGMIQKLAPLAKMGINTSLGSGKQFLPWIDIRDLVCLYDFILNHHEMSGIYNTIATESITMNQFSELLLKSFGKKKFLPNIPQFIVQLLFGEMSVMLLEGSKVSNEKLKNMGFHWEFDYLSKTLKSTK